ncbi:hypothetical protein [Salarchaeum sp. JOR-1]|uniref:hypothetical protein n=1 Tax=Salarchaeum sp. JOR-1 TaxID=2599399 RepID=UPI0011987371|nr:hypothetical protein [Salarchaeum sp. JOR-1]QDX39582.1 hypothetical protein FQU85_01260 [Salarchaeum sp. JOR-1]
MDRGRAIYRFAELYVATLVVAALLTAGWLVLPNIAGAPELAGVWFAVGGFGVLVLFTIGVGYLTR